MNYNIEPVLEAALVSLLTAQNVTAGASHQSEELATPRVDVRFELGTEREGFQVPGSSPGHIFPNTYEGQFTLSVITDRDRNTSPSHSSFRATVRQIMSETPGPSWEAAIDAAGGGFRILSLGHLATTYDVLDQDTALDASVMSYSAVIRFI